MPKPAFRPRILTRGTNLKLVASGEVDETMLEALEDYVKRQKKRLSARPTIDSPKARAEMRAFMKDDDEEAAVGIRFPSLARLSMLMSNYLAQK